MIILKEVRTYRTTHRARMHKHTYAHKMCGGTGTKCAHVVCMARATKCIGNGLLVQGSKYTPRGLRANIHLSPQDVCHKHRKTKEDIANLIALPMTGRASDANAKNTRTQRRAWPALIRRPNASSSGSMSVSRPEACRPR